MHLSHDVPTIAQQLKKMGYERLRLVSGISEGRGFFRRISVLMSTLLEMTRVTPMASTASDTAGSKKGGSKGARGRLSCLIRSIGRRPIRCEATGREWVA